MHNNNITSMPFSSFHENIFDLQVVFNTLYVVAALYVLYPYLTIHMRELGINVEEAAIMSAVTPIVAIIMPPIAGVVADRIGNFKVRWQVYDSGRNCNPSFSIPPIPY